MQKLNGESLDKLLRGKHVQFHRQGLWNGIWTDMFIETTYMRYRHGPPIGITLIEKAVHRWAMHLHLCSILIKDRTNLKDSSSVDITFHKEEMASWIKYDENERQVIGEKLKTCINTLNTAGQASTLTSH